MAKTDSQTSLKCPVGESQCFVIDQVIELKHEIDSLSDLLRTDNLTGLFNQRHLIQTLELEIERCQRSGDTMAIIMFDLDHFKQVNDTWGHEAGNQVLIKVGEIVQQQIRKLDIGCRYGGEEFVIVLPNTGMLEAVSVAERIRVAIEDSKIKVDEGVIQPTSSFGVDIYNPEKPGTPEQLIHQADGFLYQAKESGRNQVCHAPILPSHDAAEVTDDERDALFDLFGDD